jgi:membrane protein
MSRAPVASSPTEPAVLAGEPRADPQGPAPPQADGAHQAEGARQAVAPPPAEAATRIGLSGWRGILTSTAKKLARDRVSLSAGSLAYHWFLAMFPAIIAVLGSLMLTHFDSRDVTNVTHALEKALPSGVATVFTGAVTAATNRTSGSIEAVVVGIVAAIWSASGGLSALQQALDIAYEVPIDRTFLKRRLYALPLMAATLVLGGTGGALIVLGAPIGTGIEGHVPLHGTGFLVVWTIVRWVATLVAISGLLSVVYSVGPNRRLPKWQWVSPGGVLATAVFLLASLAFSFYVTKFGSYGKTYGAFAGVAILIFWLFLTGLAVLAGGELNAELERRSAAGGLERRSAAAELERPAAAGELEPSPRNQATGTSSPGR